MQDAVSNDPAKNVLLFRTLYVIVIVFAAVFVWIVGHRGVFLLDQSILFDGAWRVFQGQIPYRDFYSAFPPVAFLIQAAFFRLFGVDFSAMVLSAAVLNGLATACVVWMVRKLQPEQPAMAFMGGLVTAVWFEAPFGTLFFEQTAFFFNLLALVVVVKSMDHPPNTARWMRIGAGVLLAASMLSKQNAGAEFIPVAIAVAVSPFFPSFRKMVIAAFQMGVGICVGLGSFVLWVWQFSSLSKFWYFYVAMTRQIGADRIHPVQTIGRMLVLFPTMAYVAPVVVALLLSVLVSRRIQDTRTHRTQIVCIVGCVLFQNLFKLHTDNEVEDSLPFLGLVYALAFGLLLEASSRWAVLKEGTAKARTRSALYFCAGLIVFAFPMVAGVDFSIRRVVIEFWGDTTFERSLNVAGMSRVKWGDPTVIDPWSGTKLSKDDFEALNRFLDDVNKNFFVFPDTTMLYGLHGRVSPQPWLYFSAGHSFTKEELPELDARVVASLTRNEVKVIVLEKRSWLGNERLLEVMPELRSWIDANFQRDRSFGIFDVWVDRRLIKEREALAKK